MSERAKAALWLLALIALATGLAIVGGIVGGM